MRGLYPGCAAPVRSQLVATSDDEDFDLSEATAARIVCAFSNGSVATWEAEMSDASATSLTLTRLHDPEDVAEGTEGTAYLHGEIDLPGGTVVTRGIPITVLTVD